MSRAAKGKLALVISLLAGAGVVVSSGALIASYVQTVRHAAAEKQRLAQLDELARKDTLQVATLAAEQQRQTQASLARSHRNTVWSRMLIFTSILFLAGIRWFIALRGKTAPMLERVLLERGVPGRKAAALTADRPNACQCRTEPQEPVDVSAVDEIVAACGRGPGAAIPILQAIQSRYRYLPEAVLARVCERRDVTPAQITGVASFYTQFRRKPMGEHLVRVCHGTACHVAGADAITQEIRRALNIPGGTDTDANLRYTIEPVACMGCCTLAPVAQLGGATHGHLEADTVAALLQDHLSAGPQAKGWKQPLGVRRIGRDEGEPAEIRIGLGSCCMAGGSDKVFAAMERELAAVEANAVIKRVGCVGMCHRTPLVEAVIPGRPVALYAGVGPDDVRAIVRRHFRARTIGRRASHAVAAAMHMIGRKGDSTPTRTLQIERRDPPVAAFLGPQKHIATEHSGAIDPTDFDEYVRHDGFSALRRCIGELTPDQVIAELRSSGMRGRGGAGFPTGEKWARVRAATGDPKYVICNGDEGDPGAFMDRMLMESFPYRIIEGLAIAAYAVGANEGYFYIRAEYPLAGQRISEAIEQCEKHGLLGENALGGGLRLKVGIKQGAGAFVCGEETALISSIEGQRGMPKLRPPYPAERGLWDAPTLVNNVETLATVPWIIRNGAPAFATLGTPTSKGTKVFALAGKVNRGGLIEVPMGVTIRRIVEEIGGGIKQGRPFKAVQIGGPSGGCIPASLCDTPVDFEALAGVGAIMGSGGLVVLDETDCMVDLARYFLAFTQDQSCGKCTYCRIGTRRMLDIMDRLCEGRGVAEDLAALESLARSVIAGSLCGLGKTAPNPVLTTLKYFRDEYEAHLTKRCPAGRCKSLIKYQVTERCIGCTICAQHCPADAIGYAPYQRHVIDDVKCTRCDMCRQKCPEDAILVE